MANHHRTSIIMNVVLFIFDIKTCEYIQSVREKLRLRDVRGFSHINSSLQVLPRHTCSLKIQDFWSLWHSFCTWLSSSLLITPESNFTFKRTVSPQFSQTFRYRYVHSFSHTLRSHCHKYPLFWSRTVSTWDKAVSVTRRNPLCVLHSWKSTCNLSPFFKTIITCHNSLAVLIYCPALPPFPPLPSSQPVDKHGNAR